MIAARIDRQDAEPTPRRDLIGTILFYRLSECEQHPGLMLFCLGALIVAAGVLEGLMS